MTDTPKKQTPKPINPNFHGKKGRSGPPKGNTNALRHGLRAGNLSEKLRYIQNRNNGFRRQLEQLVFELKGEITLQDASIISSIVKWERHGALATHWLRTEGEKMSASDKLKFSEAIAKASDNRDKAIRMLGLDRQQDAPWILGTTVEKGTSDEQD